MSEKEFIIRKPDDWHLHLRDGEMLASVIQHSAANFERAIIMPNLVPPVVTTDDAIAYKERINQVIPHGMSFQPLMTLYLTEATKTSDIKRGVDLGVVSALKLYPAGATTNSENGVKEFGNVYSILEFMAEVDIPLLIHGEVTDPEIDIFDREAVFIERVLDPLRKRIPELRIVMEHITTKDAVDYVIQGGPNIAATVTTHHLIINRNA
ncbi:MAG: amidohydrolase family protein, partial [SAR324 cluster bacterium]|nr:amidohydrolase family protein [SAR324 cluster bacterium]